MSIKKYFTGKSGLIFWINIVGMVVLIAAVPFVTLQFLNSFTHHGEKVEVPSVVGKSVFDAENMLMDKDLKAIVTDSTYNKNAKPGAVLDQLPKAGSEVKSGRVIYLTVNYNGEPIVTLPDVVKGGSVREAESMLKSLGFKLGPCERVYGHDKDLVVSMKIGGKRVYGGQKVSRNKVITLVVGAGVEDTLDIEDSYIMDEDVLGGYDDDDSGDNDFDVDL